MGGFGAAGMMMMQQALGGGNRHGGQAINVPMVNIPTSAHAPYAVPAYGGSSPSAPPPYSSSASSSSAAKSPSAALSEMKKMLDQGLINQAEYDAKKKEILASM